MNWLFRVWRRLLHGLWFRPSIIAFGFVVLGIAVPLVDAWLGEIDVPVLYGSGPETARVLLATIAGSLITVLALVFSLTLIAMQLVSTQLTPRAIRGFLGAAMTQVAAGTFVGTVLYAFLTMRHVRSASEGAASYVPQLSVTLGLMFGVLALGMLLIFVNHITTWMQLSSITRRIAVATLAAVDAAFEESFRAGAAEAFDAPAGAPFDVGAPRSGFVQYLALSNGHVVPPAEVRDLQFLVGAGEFIAAGEPMLRVWLPEERARECRGALTDLVVIGDERDVEQDVAFGIRQLVDIALRGLSPGVNDPTTAVGCINHLRVILGELAGRRLGACVQRDEQANVLVPRPDFDAFLELAFGEIAHFAADQPRVMREMDLALRRIEARAAAAGADRRVGALRALRSRLATDRSSPDPQSCA